MNARNIATAMLLAATAAPALAQMMMVGHGGMMGGSARHRYVMRHGLDPRYASRTNPLAPTAANIARGKALYASNCAACHGVTGRGDGAAGKQLNPPPADLTRSLRMPMASDAFLDWTVAEGGAPVGSAMPAFRSTLSAEDIWRVILYLRTL